MSRYFALLLLAGFLTGCATQAATSGRIVIQDRSTQVAVTINERDRALIQDYYGNKRKTTPPGLAKRQGNLPPGLAKRDTLPPGLQRESLPPELERQLTALPNGYVRVRVGQDVVLLDNRTRVVLDVIYGVAI
jgi:hypothetical protein